MKTPEMELIAHDPLNPGLGYVLKITHSGEPYRTVELGMQEALALIEQTMNTAIYGTEGTD